MKLAEVVVDGFDRIREVVHEAVVGLGVRLVSVLSDDLQHAGQAAYVRGLVLRDT